MVYSILINIRWHDQEKGKINEYKELKYVLVLTFHSKKYQKRVKKQYYFFSFGKSSSSDSKNKLQQYYI